MTRGIDIHAYNEALKSRGSLTIWFGPDVSWEAASTGRRGWQQTYSDAASQTCLSMKVLFGIGSESRNPDARRLRGERWTQITAKKKIVPIKDVELKQYAADNHSWVSVAYEYSSKFIHLTNLWDYDGPDPLLTISANDRETMRSYLETYHCFARTDVTMADLIEYLPKVFEKIRDNVEGYVDQRDGLVLGTQ